MKPIFLPKKFINEDDSLEDNLETDINLFRMKTNALNKITIHYLAKGIRMTDLYKITPLVSKYLYIELSKSVHIFQNPKKNNREMILIYSFGVVIFWFLSNEK